MSSYPNRSGGGGGRRSGRGSRRGGGGGRRRDDEFEPREPRAPREPATPPAKPTLLQKILGFFTGGAKKKPTNGTHTPAPRERPVYQSGTVRREGGDAGSYTPSRGGAPARSESPARAEAPARSGRKPEAVEVTTPKLYIGNLVFEATESDLFNLFSGVGAVKNAEIVTFRDTEKSKGFGFVTMSTVDEAKRAVTELHDKDFMGRKLVVSGAKTPVERETPPATERTGEEPPTPASGDSAAA